MTVSPHVTIDINTQLTEQSTSPQNITPKSELNVIEMKKKYKVILKDMMQRSENNQRSINKLKDGEFGTIKGPKNVKILTGLSILGWGLSFVALLMGQYFQEGRTQRAITTAVIVASFVFSAGTALAQWVVEKKKEELEEQEKFKPEDVSIIQQLADFFKLLNNVRLISEEIKRKASQVEMYEAEENRELESLLDTKLHDCMTYLKSLPKVDGLPSNDELFTSIINILPEDNIYRQTINSILEIVQNQENELYGTTPPLTSSTTGGLAQATTSQSSSDSKICMKLEESSHLTVDGLDLANPQITYPLRNSFKGGRFGYTREDGNDSASFNEKKWKDQTTKLWSDLEKLRGESFDFLDLPQLRVYKNGHIAIPAAKP